jgi:hypothetical protein
LLSFFSVELVLIGKSTNGIVENLFGVRGHDSEEGSIEGNFEGGHDVVVWNERVEVRIVSIF